MAGYLSDSLNYSTLEEDNDDETPSKFNGGLSEWLVKIKNDVSEQIQMDRSASILLEKLVAKLFSMICSTKPHSLGDVERFMANTLPESLSSESPKACDIARHVEKAKKKSAYGLSIEKMHPLVNKELGYKVDSQLVVFIFSVLAYVAQDIIQLTTNYINHCHLPRGRDADRVSRCLSKGDIRIAMRADAALTNIFDPNEEQDCNSLRGSTYNGATSATGGGVAQTGGDFEETTSYSDMVHSVYRHEVDYQRHLDLLLKVFRDPFVQLSDSPDCDQLTAAAAQPPPTPTVLHTRGQSLPATTTTVKSTQDCLPLSSASPPASSPPPPASFSSSPPLPSAPTPTPSVISSTAVDEIFSSLPDIHSLTINLLSALEQIIEMAVEGEEGGAGSEPLVGECFSEPALHCEFTAYEDYARQVLKPDLISKIHLLIENEHFKNLISPGGSILRLAFKYLLPRLLLAPVSHFLHYLDFLRSLRHHATDGEDMSCLDNAITSLISIEASIKQFIEDSVDSEKAALTKRPRLTYLRSSELSTFKGSHKMMEIQQSIDGWEGKDIERCCFEHIMESSISKWTGKRDRVSERVAFLFDNLLVLCKPIRRPSTISYAANPDLPPPPHYKLKERFLLKKVKLVDRDDTDGWLVKDG